MKKKMISIVLVFSMCISALCGCSKKDTKNAEAKSEKDAIHVVCTIFPEYDWVKQVIGNDNDSVEVSLLMDNGTDLHNFQPTAADIAEVASSDLFLYVGGESDGWVDDALKEATNPNMVVLNLMDVLKESVKEEEIVEGMQGEEEESEEGEAEEEGPEYDEHVWLSVKNAAAATQAISDALGKLEAKNASLYSENAANYIKELNQLDSEYQDMVNQASRKTVLFGDRFPFRYLVDDYGIKYYAAFIGCSAETEASFDTIVFLAGKVDELALPAVFAIDSSDQSIAKTILQNTKDKNQKILVLDSMQSTTADDIKNGSSYLSIMKQNLVVLKEALN